MEVFPLPRPILTGGICLWTERYFNSVSLYLSVFVFSFAIGPQTSFRAVSSMTSKSMPFLEPLSTYHNRNNNLFQVYYDSDNIRRDVVAFNPDVKPEVDYLSNSDIL